MSELKLPFWIVSEIAHPLNSPAKIPCDDPHAAHAFTETPKLTAFMAARDGGRWDVKLVSDHPALIVAIADLHQNKCEKVCFDPEPDGKGGRSVPLKELMLFSHSL